MSEFQLGLLGIGIAVVVAVMAFNKWQEIRYRRQSERSFDSEGADALVDPVSGAGHADYEHHLARDADAIFAEKPVADSAVISEKPAQVVQSQLAPSTFSNAINLIAELDAPDGISTRDLDLTELGSGIAARISVEGFLEGVWVPPLADSRYTRLNVALQLVNRQGPVSRQELEMFSAWMGDFADRSGATLAVIDVNSVLQQAMNIEKFCGEVDIQIAVHIVAGNAPFQGTRIRAIAESAGLILEADGRFRRRDEDGRELFRLLNEGGVSFQVEIMRELTTASVILEFDVARSPGGSHSFAKFRQFSEHLASGLGGRIVDDNRKPLDDAGFNAIAKELTGIYKEMATHRIPPGSPDSLRLFS